MKVCFKIIKSYSGSDVWAANLSRSLKEIRIETGVHCHPHLYQYFPYLLKLKDKDVRADVIHTNSLSGFVFKKNIPLVVTEHHIVHDPLLDKYKSIPQRIFHKLVYEYEKKSFGVADQITCVSDYTKDRLKEVFGYDSIRIYNGVDTELFFPKKTEVDIQGLNKDKIILFFAGNLTRRKGADLLPKIMKSLGDNFVLICASGFRKKVLRINENMYILGCSSQKDLADYYNCCDIFLFPTRLEGFGLAVAEAMACAKPVITTNCSSLPELIVNAKGGFLCKIDNIKEFVEKILVLAESHSLRKEMGQFNRERVEKHFTLRQMAENYYTLYKDLLKKAL